MKKVLEPAREIPVAHEVDVVVVGGGPAGIPAAIAAARNGVRVLLVERHGCLGGLMTVGMVESFSWFARKDTVLVDGIAHEIEMRLGSMDGVSTYPRGTGLAFDTEKAKLLADRMMEEAEVELLFHSWGARTLMDGTSARGVIIENKSGRQAILASVVVDATGDGDMAASAGAPFAKGRPSDGLMQPATLTCRISGIDVVRLKQWLQERPKGRTMRDLLAKARENGEYHVVRDGIGWQRLLDTGEITGVNGSRIHNVDATVAEDFTRAEIEGRKQVWESVEFFRKYVPGMEKCELAAIAGQVGFRESRRIVGDYVLTDEDVLAERRFPDSIARIPSFVDVHSPTGSKTRLDFPVGAAYSQIPYRCIVPREVENIVVAGRCISASHEAVGSTRGIMCCMATGEAAGTAAALAAKQHSTVRQLDLSVLQDTLRGHGLTID